MLKELVLNAADEPCLDGRAVRLNPLGKVFEIELPRELLFAGDRNYLKLCIERMAPEGAEAYLFLAKDVRAFPKPCRGLFYWVRFYSLGK